METTFKINTDSLTPGFIENIKRLFPHKTVEITIQPADETEYILSNPVFAPLFSSLDYCGIYPKLLQWFCR